MGFAGISPGSLLLIFLIVLVLFGSKRVGELGSDLGKMVKNFKKGLESHDNDHV